MCSGCLQMGLPGMASWLPQHALPGVACQHRASGSCYSVLMPMGLHCRLLIGCWTEPVLRGCNSLTQFNGMSISAAQAGNTRVQNTIMPHPAHRHSGAGREQEESVYNLAEQAEQLTISPAAAGVTGRNVLGVRPMIRTSPSDRVSHHHNSDQLRDILNPIRGIRDMQRRCAQPESHWLVRGCCPCWAPLSRSQACHTTTRSKGRGCQMSLLLLRNLLLLPHRTSLLLPACRQGLQPTNYARLNRQAIRELSTRSKQVKVEQQESQLQEAARQGTFQQRGSLQPSRQASALPSRCAHLAESEWQESKATGGLHASPLDHQEHGAAGGLRYGHFAREGDIAQQHLPHLQCDGGLCKPGFSIAAYGVVARPHAEQAHVRQPVLRPARQYTWQATVPLSHMQAQPTSEHWCQQITAPESSRPLLTAPCFHQCRPSSAHGSNFVVEHAVAGSVEASAALPRLSRRLRPILHVDAGPSKLTCASPSLAVKPPSSLTECFVHCPAQAQLSPWARLCGRKHHRQQGAGCSSLGRAAAARPEAAGGGGALEEQAHLWEGAALPAGRQGAAGTAACRRAGMLKGTTGVLGK